MRTSATQIITFVLQQYLDLTYNSDFSKRANDDFIIVNLAKATSRMMKSDIARLRISIETH